MQPATRPDPQPETAAVQCRGLTKQYGEGDNAFLALRGVDLTIPFGELVMLVGPSGCGKTTLISVIAGILDRTGGDCRVLDRDFEQMTQAERTVWRGRNIGFVFQAFNLIPALSAAENVAIPLLIQGVERARAVGRAREMLERVGLPDKTRALPSQLSGGQQQRVAIARALVHEPSLIVCDEPTSALDADTGHRVMEILREHAVQPGRSLLVVTHDQRIFAFGDRIVRMDDGRIDAVGNGDTHPTASAAEAP